MEIYLFPYAEVEKSDSIVIYGMGDIGRQYVKQIQSMNYCNVLCGVDRNWKNINVPGIEVKAVESLTSLEFDKVVIATSNLYVSEIRESIRAMGISQSKIVTNKYPYPMDLDIKRLMNDVTWMKSQMLNLWLMTYSIDSYCQNEFYVRNEENFTKYPLYQFLLKEKELMKVMDVEGNYDYVRIGNTYDGGYIMLNDFGDSTIAYSFGIGPDVSWDLVMAEKGYEIYQYDPTIWDLPVQHERFHFYRIGICGEEETENYKTMQHIIEDNHHSLESNIILKMDVEEAEWDFLIDVSEETLSQFKQIVFEMHGCERIEFQDKIIKGLEKLNCTHQCVYIHSNNYGPVEYMGDINMPYALETTWVRKSDYNFTESKRVFPGELDHRCFSQRRENIFGKWN